MQPDNVVPLDDLLKESLGQVICYPKYDIEELKCRLKELKRLGVTAVEFAGERMVFNIPVLGKGCVGVVVAAQMNQGKIALKIRRVDANRPRMQREAEMLRRANSMGIGPPLIDVSQNFLLMNFVEGTLLPQWVEKLKGRGTWLRLGLVVRDVLEQCLSLDGGGLDHGELSRAPRHIIVDSQDKPHIVDFESASNIRSVSNVTSISQYLFLRGKTAKAIDFKLGKVQKAELIAALRTYKREQTRENFNEILGLYKLHNI